MSSCADFFFTFCPKAWFASATSACSPTVDGVLRSNAAASCSAQLHLQIAPKQRTCRVVLHAQQPCWSSNGSPALNFTSGQIEALLPSRGAALTAHKTSIAHYVSCPVAPWHACTCKAVVCQQAALAPCIRHSLTPCSTQLRSLNGLSPLRCFSSVLTIATIGGPAPLKMHR